MYKEITQYTQIRNSPNTIICCCRFLFEPRDKLELMNDARVARTKYREADIRRQPQECEVAVRQQPTVRLKVLGHWGVPHPTYHCRYHRHWSRYVSRAAGRITSSMMHAVRNTWNQLSH